MSNPYDIVPFPVICSGLDSDPDGIPASIPNFLFWVASCSEGFSLDSQVLLLKKRRKKLTF